MTIQALEHEEDINMLGGWCIMVESACVRGVRQKCEGGLYQPHTNTRTHSAKRANVVQRVVNMMPMVIEHVAKVLAVCTVVFEAGVVHGLVRTVLG